MPLTNANNVTTEVAMTLLNDWQGIFQQMALKHAGDPVGDEYLRQSKRYGLAADHITKLSERVKVLESTLRQCSKQFADNTILLQNDRYADHHERLGLATDNEQYVYDITEVLDGKPNEDNLGR